MLPMQMHRMKTAGIVPDVELNHLTECNLRQICAVTSNLTVKIPKIFFRYAQCPAMCAVFRLIPRSSNYSLHHLECVYPPDARSCIRFFVPRERVGSWRDSRAKIISLPKRRRNYAFARADLPKGCQRRSIFNKNINALCRCQSDCLYIKWRTV